MRYTFTGKNVTITDAMKEKTTQKIGRIEKLLPEDMECLVTMSSVKNNYTVEVTIPMRKRILRAEVTSTAVSYLAIVDELVDILEKQIVKYKGQLRHRSGKDSKFTDELKYFLNQDDISEEDGIKIEKTKRFALKPMDAEEAVMEMELLNHNFYVFRNGDTDEVNVVYKRKNGSFGLIEPEF